MVLSKKTPDMIMPSIVSRTIDRLLHVFNDEWLPLPKETIRRHTRRNVSVSLPALGYQIEHSFHPCCALQQYCFVGREVLTCVYKEEGSRGCSDGRCEGSAGFVAHRLGVSH